jgi:probable HAF family extracellular repeat protein
MLGYQYRALVTSAGTTAISAPVPLVVGTSSAKLAWLQNNFTSDQLGNPSIVSDTAQPIGDGVPNLLKYAFNISPWENGQPFLPQPTTSGGNIMLTFNAPQSDLTYTVQASTDLINWDTTDVMIQTNGTQVAASYTIAPKSAFPQPGSYQITDLGTINGADTYAYRVNAKGHVAGRSGTANFLWTPENGMIVITNNAMDWPFMGLNDSDQVVGDTADDHAYLWYQGNLTYLLDAGGNPLTVAYDINNSGKVTGQVGFTIVTWLNGAIAYPPTFGGDTQSAFKINSSGNMAGIANPYPGYRLLAVWFNGGTTIQNLNTISGEFATINDLNHVAAADEANNAFLWKGGSQYVQIGDLGGGETFPKAVNNADIIVGYSNNSSGQQHAFIWADLNGNNQTDPGEMQDLNSFLPPNSGWVLDDAEGINDSGVIVGSGLHNGQRRAFIMSLNISPSSKAFLRVVVAPSP